MKRNCDGFPASRSIVLAHRRAMSRIGSSPAQAFSAATLSEELSMPQELIELLCRQLEMAFVLRQDPRESDRFRLSTPDDSNIQLRRKISAQLIRELCGEITPPRLRFPGEDLFDD
ncbi:MAG: hypothetical protein V1876_02165 [Candidatus Peregrinibacteria bacterium]